MPTGCETAYHKSGKFWPHLKDLLVTGSDVNGVEITPVTSMAQVRAKYMNGGMTAANIAAANREIGAYFMVNDILSTPPMDPLKQGSGTNATQDSLNYGMAIAAMSQYAQNLGLRILPL